MIDVKRHLNALKNPRRWNFSVMGILLYFRQNSHKTDVVLFHQFVSKVRFMSLV